MYGSTTSCMQDPLRVVYRIRIPEGTSAAAHARDIAVEQTVEIPFDIIPQAVRDQHIPGRVAEIVPVDEAARVYDATIDYRPEITAFSIPQFLNVVFGNISIKQHIRITRLSLPESLQQAFGGPRFGIEGVRAMIGVHGRPLTCSALKPMGLSSREFARLAGALTRGGIDLIKDDHGITDQPCSRFQDRVARCAEAIAEANQRTGARTLYFPTVCAPADRIAEQAGFAAAAGAAGVLVAPTLIGPDWMRYLADTRDLAIMAHPAFAGTLTGNREHGIAIDVLYGTLFRAFGADISIFPNWGGRFGFTRQECLDLAEALRRPDPVFNRAFPCPAGGMTLERVGEICEAFGPDSVLLIGGDLLKAGAQVEGAAKKFMDVIRARYDADTALPVPPGRSTSCAQKDHGTVADVLACRDYTWASRERVPYKLADGADYRGITRTELIGRNGERTRFDLRYFEIEPGGYSSHECHVHEHVVIGVRGAGILCKNGREHPINVHDVGFIGPNEPHQMRNPGRAPFGFFCIVDHDRDKPRPVPLEQPVSDRPA